MSNLLKRVFDICFSILLIVLLSPIMVATSLLIVLETKGPIIFRQRRLGLHGKEFIIYKFRSMVKNAERLGTGIFNYNNDPRVTKVGRVIRKLSIDELPQLFNILMGTMSFVGPRPPLTYELGQYRDFDDSLKRRFVMKPGVTGLAQINGRNELSWDEKIIYDLKYIDNFMVYGILGDIKILFFTAIKVIRMEGSYELHKNVESDKSRMSND